MDSNKAESSIKCPRPGLIITEPGGIVFKVLEFIILAVSSVNGNSNTKISA